MIADTAQSTPREPSRARAVFSTQDFTLLRTAVLYYLEQGPAGPERVQLGHLYHRLGRLG